MRSNLPGAESWRRRSRHSLLNLIYCYAAATVRMCQRHLWSVEDISLTGRSLFCSSLLIKHKLMRPTPRFSGPAPATVAAVVAPAFLTAEYITWCISSQTSRSCMSTNDLGKQYCFSCFLFGRRKWKKDFNNEFHISIHAVVSLPGQGGVFCETRARTGELMASKKKLPIRVCFQKRPFFYLNWFTLLVAPGEVHV